MSVLSRFRRKRSRDICPEREPEGGIKLWTVITDRGPTFTVEAEELCWGYDGSALTGEQDKEAFVSPSVLAFNEDSYAGDPAACWTVCPPGVAAHFTSGREAQMMAEPIEPSKVKVKVRVKGKAKKRSNAQKALLVWQTEQSTRPAAMYGRVLQDDAQFASGKNQELYVYERGVYVSAENYVDARLQDLAGEKWSRHLRNETVAWLVGCSPGLSDGLGPDTINVRNGLLVWRRGKWQLRPHSPEVRTAVQLPVSFDPDAECPLYDQLLTTSVPDALTRDFLDEWSGYNLTSDYAHQKALMLGGQSGSGKSQYLHVLGRLLGPNNMTAIMLQALGDNKFAAADLYGKLANICADISSSELRMTGMFKQLTGGDVIRAEKKYKDAFDFNNAAKLSFSANEIPATRDATSAFFDRWVVVRFPNKFRDTIDERKNIGRQIANNPDEMSGVLLRALRGLTQLRRQGSFTVGKAMRQAHDEFRREADSVALFVADFATPSEPRRIEKSVLYQHYESWCHINGHQSLSSTRFYARLRDWTPSEELSVRVTKSQGFERFTVEAQGSGG